MDSMQKAAMNYGKVCPVICLIMAMAIQLGIMLPYFGLTGVAS